MYVRMARISPLVSLSVDDLAQVVRWEAVPSTPQQVALRCRLVLAAAAERRTRLLTQTPTRMVPRRGCWVVYLSRRKTSRFQKARNSASTPH